MAPTAGDHKQICVTVYGSSSSGIAESYKTAARRLGRLIAEAGWVQCNGGGKHGLMGAATEGAREVSGTVDCVILDKFVLANMHHGGFRDILVSKTMTERKHGLSERADAFVCLPGGLGTLEEVSEVMSWLQLGLHTKPVVFLNTNGFYDSLWSFHQRCIRESFVSKACDEAIFITSDIAEVITIIREYRPVTIDKASIHEGNIKADWTES